MASTSRLLLERRGGHDAARNHYPHHGPGTAPDILEQAQHMKPAGFTLQIMPPNASAADLAAALRDAEYLLGFVGFFPDEAYTEATASSWSRC
jgi:hypothetical protein